MISSGKQTARVALFSALAYVAALASFYIPNVSLIFIVIFISGAIWGLHAGLIVGGMGEFLWTFFNPFGMAPLPMTLAQIGGMMIVGALGASVYKSSRLKKTTPAGFALFAFLGLAAGLSFQLIVNGVDTLLYGQSWTYLMAGLGFSLATIVSNILIFPVCYPLTVKIAAKESGA